MCTAIRTSTSRLGERVADRERRAHRPLGIVLVRDRRAEDGHDGVADELLDRAAVPLELAADRRVVRRRASRGHPPGRAAPPARSSPTRSANRIVTTLRSSSSGSGTRRAPRRSRRRRQRRPGSPARRPGTRSLPHHRRSIPKAAKTVKPSPAERAVANQKKPQLPVQPLARKSTTVIVRNVRLRLTRTLVG